MVRLDVFRIGEVLVDTGATTTVVSEELVQGSSTFNLRPSTLNWKSVVGTSLPVVGELSMLLRYKEKLVDLKRVVVIKNTVYPLILGVDWIVASGAEINARDGKLTIEIPACYQKLNIERNREEVTDRSQVSEEKKNKLKQWEKLVRGSLEQ